MKGRASRASGGKGTPEEVTGYPEILLDTTLDGYILADTEGRILHVNRAYCELTGYSKEELAGMNIRDVEAALSPPEIEEKIREMVRAGSARFETQHRTKDRRVVDLDVSIRVIRKGDTPLVAAFVRDLTELKGFAEAHRRSEDRYRFLFEETPVSLWEEDISAVRAALEELRARGVTDLRGYCEANPDFVRRCAGLVRVTDVNRATVEMFGARSKEELLGSLDKVFIPESFDLFREQLVGLAEGEVTFGGEAISGTLDGRRIHVLLRTHAPLVRGRGDRVLVSIMDITARKRAEEELREALRQLTTLFKNLPGMAYRCANDPDWTMELVSEGARDLTGYEPEEFIGNAKVTYADLIHPDDREEVWEGVQAAIEDGRPFRLTYRIRTKDGRERWVWEQGEAVPSAEPGTTKLEGFITDITDRKRAEAHEERAREQLRALARRLVGIREEERTAIARELHDELSQALNVFRMELAMLREEVEGDRPELVKELDGMVGLVDRKVAAVQDLCARLRPPILDVLGLGPALEWQAGELEKRSTIRFRVETPRDGPQLDPELATAAFRIAQEALTNAVRHARPTQVNVRLQVSGDRLELVVEDDGVGIPDAALEDERSLGLLGMQERALIVGGKVGIRPLPGGGTQVRLEAPVGPRSAGASAG